MISDIMPSQSEIQIARPGHVRNCLVKAANLAAFVVANFVRVHVGSQDAADGWDICNKLGWTPIIPAQIPISLLLILPGNLPLR